MPSPDDPEDVRDRSRVMRNRRGEYVAGKQMFLGEVPGACATVK
jgi:hypothetical protein